MPRHNSYAIDMNKGRNCYNYGVLNILQSTIEIEG